MDSASSGLALNGLIAASFDGSSTGLVEVVGSVVCVVGIALWPVGLVALVGA